MEVDSGTATDEMFAAWCEGRTGYPMVDAGMRQLLAEGWMHNRLRMLTASFLVKDLHLDWTRGARWFMRHLVDGDLASNQHGWQWVAGTGTDAAPYVRVFNPVAQGERFDPLGTYVQRWVPELAIGAAPVRPRAVAGSRRSAARVSGADRGPRRRAREALRRFAAVRRALTAPPTGRALTRIRPVALGPNSANFANSSVVVAGSAGSAGPGSDELGLELGDA